MKLLQGLGGCCCLLACLSAGCNAPPATSTEPAPKTTVLKNPDGTTETRTYDPAAGGDR